MWFYCIHKVAQVKPAKAYPDGVFFIDRIPTLVVTITGSPFE